MSTKIRRVDYFYVTVKDTLGEGYRLLSELAEEGVDFVAFNAVPIGPATVQMVLFPDDPEKLLKVAKESGLVATGPQPALLVHGDNQLGALAEIHRRLFDAGVNVYASNGVTSGDGGFGYILHLRPDDFEKAAATLGV